MEVYEFDQLIRARFENVKHTLSKHPERPTSSHLKCKKCGWACIFTTGNLAEWSMSTKNSITAWLMRHAVCTC